MSASVSLTRFKWSATYELPNGEHKRIENISQSVSADECYKIIERLIKKIGGPGAVHTSTVLKPLDSHCFTPLTATLPAVLLPAPLPFNGTKTLGETKALNKEFEDLYCFTEFNLQRQEAGVNDPFYKALPKDVAVTT